MNECIVDYECRLYPRMRPPEEHAWAIYAWPGLQDAIFYPTSTWLRMASGLKQVQIDTAAQDPGYGWCGTASDYDDASSDTYSRWQTELTRLLYVYGALECLVRALYPNLDEAAPILTPALDLMRPESRVPILHYERVVGHLRDHVCETYLHDNRKLMQSFSRMNDEPPGAIALRVGVKFRHLFAHGSLVAPEPDDSEITWKPSGYIETCMARAASSCLLMSIQIILTGQASLNESTFDHSDVVVDHGFWLPSRPFGNEWVYSLPVSEYLLTLHLREGDDPKPMIPGQMRLDEIRLGTIGS
jgi:hypothetical protein